jgi:polar amino acid transport system substrate-binding protein
VGSSLSAQLRIFTEISGKSQYYYEQHHLTGSTVELVREIQKRIGDTTEIEVVPWARGYCELKKEPSVLLFSTTLTEERKPLFKWVGPVLRLDWAFFVKKDSGITITSLEEAKQLTRIGSIHDDAREQFLKGEGFFNFESVRESSLNVRKLLAERVDAIISSDTGLYASMENIGVPKDAIVEEFSIRTYELFLAFSADTPDDTVFEWHEALSGMYEDGTFETIYRRFYPDRKLPVFKSLK